MHGPALRSGAFLGGDGTVPGRSVAARSDNAVLLAVVPAATLKRARPGWVFGASGKNLRAARPISGEPPKTSHLKPRTGTPAYSDEFPFQGRFATRRAMQPPSPGDVFLVLAIAGVVLLIEIGMLILLVML